MIVAQWLSVTDSDWVWLYVSVSVMGLLSCTWLQGFQEEPDSFCDTNDLMLFLTDVSTCLYYLKNQWRFVINLVSLPLAEPAWLRLHYSVDWSNLTHWWWHSDTVMKAQSDSQQQQTVPHLVEVQSQMCVTVWHFWCSDSIAAVSCEHDSGTECTQYHEKSINCWRWHFNPFQKSVGRSYTRLNWTQ